MERNEVLQKAQSKKAIVGEMERSKIGKANWISVISAGIVAVALMIVEGALGHFAGLYAIGAVCFTWACVFYICQFVVAKRSKGVLIGAVLEGLGAAIMITNYILVNLGVI